MNLEVTKYNKILIRIEVIVYAIYHLKGSFCHSDMKLIFCPIFIFLLYWLMPSTFPSIHTYLNLLSMIECHKP